MAGPENLRDGIRTVRFDGSKAAAIQKAAFALLARTHNHNTTRQSEEKGQKRKKRLSNSDGSTELTRREWKVLLRNVWWYRSWTPHRGAQVVAEEPSPCPYNFFFFFSIRRSFLNGVVLVFNFFFLCCCYLGFCCEAGDAARWNREFDGVALHYSREDWGEYFFFLFICVFVLFV